jgi:hypothetical protein
VSIKLAATETVYMFPLFLMTYCTAVMFQAQTLPIYEIIARSNLHGSMVFSEHTTIAELLDMITL